jgi:hypothetical protein
VKEDIPLHYFQKRLEAYFDNLNTTNRTLKLWEDYDKREQCIKQLFNYYNLWEGEIFSDIETNKNGTTGLKVKQKEPYENVKESLILIFEEDEPRFYAIKFKEFKDETLAVPFNELEKYRLINNELLIFNRSDYYDKEFDSSRFLYLDTCSYVLINKQVTSVSISKYFEGNNSGFIVLSNTLTLYQVRSIEDGPTALMKYIQNKKAIRLIGGLKINRGAQYLQGYGPKILSKYEKIVLFENRKVEYQPQAQRSGRYTVRIDYCRDVSFDIFEDVTGSQVVSKNDSGWNLTTFSIDANFDLQGLNLKAEVDSDNIIRSWISINTQKRKIKINKSNILINALNNCINGKS